MAAPLRMRKTGPQRAVKQNWVSARKNSPRLPQLLQVVRPRTELVGREVASPADVVLHQRDHRRVERPGSYSTVENE